MHLEKIKLSGFKSFVDLTSITFPGELIGIVGPNGCGKSNILDAIHWVMGENSVKQLRGESLTDVIFNGSAHRKPVGRAMIELIFDNSDASIGGEYAKYHQISIRRVIDREGQSAYFLNNIRCRRRDIANLFLGTGLGSNSYAIVEQGMINRVVEAKPEELRGYIEEAAGISRYKERKHETENRIKHTQDNIIRIKDLEEELCKQLEHLKHQAKAAERYRKLKEQERLMKAKVLVVRWLKLDEEITQVQKAVEQSETLLAFYHAELQEVDTQIEEQRAVQMEGQDAYYAVQSRYHALNSDISRLEHAIEQQRARKRQLKIDLDQVEKILQQTECALKEDEEAVIALDHTIADLQPRIMQVDQDLRISDQTVGELEQLMRRWQTEWDAFNQHASKVLQTIQVQQARIEHLNQQVFQSAQYLEKIEQENRSFNRQRLYEELNQLEEKINQTSCIIANQEKKLSQILKKIHQQREKNTKYETEFNKLYDHLQVMRERYMSLQVLQQNAFGERHQEFTEWLEKHQLHDKPKLIKSLSVESGWEIAVETVLQPYLNAICIDGFHTVIEALSSLDQGVITLFDVCSEVVNNPRNAKSSVLSSKVKSDKFIHHLLERVYIADSITEALRVWKLLDVYESVITKDGIWIGKNWLRVNRGTNAQMGFIAREKKLDELQIEVKRYTDLVVRTEKALSIGKEKLMQLEKSREELQTVFLADQKNYANIVSSRNAIQIQISHVEERYQRLETEYGEHKQHQALCQQGLEEAVTLLQEAQAGQAQQACMEKTLLDQRDQFYVALDGEKMRNKEIKELRNQLYLDLQSAQIRLETLYVALDRIKQQKVGLLERRKQLFKSLVQEKFPLKQFEADLVEVLKQRVCVEGELTLAKQKISDFEKLMQTLLQNQRDRTMCVQKCQRTLEERKLGAQELKVRQSTLQEQLTEIRFDINDLLQQVSVEKVSETDCTEKLERIKIRLMNLGAINLAAISEYESLNERKGYLDKQRDDLEDALKTLKGAIYKIDCETRSRFKETFEKVSQNFQVLFPQIFGGGKAYLELMGQDLLESGIVLMAKPPGKYIKSTSLMSGGEKALTAIALIFSLFQLNPTPFCLLDEVDAPLDDVNIGRFCNLLKEMSKKIQLIFISHNKSTIEVAEYLTGITMREPGVSSVLAVDINQALEMAEA
jgi:chromosome segregation protein